MNYVLDASAIVRFLDDEAGVERMREIFHRRAVENSRLQTSAIQWGEIAVVYCRRSGPKALHSIQDRLTLLGLEIVPATANQATRVAVLHVTLKLPYADAFAVALTEELRDATLITADFDFKVADALVAVEFLPSKPKIG